MKIHFLIKIWWKKNLWEKIFFKWKKLIFFVMNFFFEKNIKFDNSDQKNKLSAGRWV